MPNRRIRAFLYFFMFLSTFLYYIYQKNQHPFIEPTDGVTYLQAAAAYAHDGLHAALALGDQAKWPFYSIMIAWMYKLTGHHVWFAEHLLDGFFISLNACIFLSLVNLLSSHKHAMFWGAGLWLTWYTYIPFWPQVIRDHGFLLCLGLSLFSYTHFLMTKKNSWAIGWIASLFLAELFRLEAIIYIFFVPFSIFFIVSGSFFYRFSLWCKLNLLPLLMGLFVLVLFLTHQLSITDFRFSYMKQELSLYFSTLHEEFTQRYLIMTHDIFYRENAYQAIVLMAGYFGVFSFYVIQQVGGIIFFAVFFFKKLIYSHQRRVVFSALWIYFFLSLAIPLLFFIEYAFLNQRYLLPFGYCFLLLIACTLPPALDALSGWKKTGCLALIIAILAAHAIQHLFCCDKTFSDDQTVGLWLKNHYPRLSIFTDTKKILFYASDPSMYQHGAAHEMWLHGTLGTGRTWLKHHNDWCQYDLLVLSAPDGKSQEEENLVILLQHNGAIGPLIKIFKRKFNGESIFIAPIQHSTCYDYVEKR